MHSSQRVALSRIAWLFGVRPEEITSEMQFGVDLTARDRSDWSENEFDQLLEDIREIRGRLGRDGPQEQDVRTVDDFCGLVESLRATDPTYLSRMEARWAAEESISGSSRWRKLIRTIIGA